MPGTSPGAPIAQGGPSPEGNEGEPTELAQAPSESEEPLAPAAERKKLAETGLNPGLIAMLGVFLLGGGAFLFRRAFARQ